MPKKIILLMVVLAIAGLATYNFKFLKRYYYVYFKTDEMFVSADTDAFDKGPELGSSLPQIKALYQGQEISSLTPLAGANGTVIVINRSLEWCPYCMRQTIELQAIYQQFQQSGINLVMLTYDAPELQQAFIDRHNISYPVLSDINAESFMNLGVLREDISPGQRNYGLPYPGMIVIDNDGVIQGKLFIEAYSSRVESVSVLNLSKEWLKID